MKILVVGSGGREHTLVWKLKQSPRVSKIYCAPGNAGIAGLAELVDIPAEAVDRLADFAAAEQIDLTVVGPEAPLTAGIVDAFSIRGLRAFGPSGAAAAIEGSKAFAKDLMQRYGIPTAAYRSFTVQGEALAYLEGAVYPLVVKADGLAAGKGVIIAANESEARAAVTLIMGDRAFGVAGDTVVIEECLVGEEVSILTFTDGTLVVPMASAQDHKRILDGDQGPNTGGMGAYSPAPVYTPELAREVYDTILVPTVRAMAAEGRPYQGVLYAGLMVTAAGPRVLEFNARFGDPETQVILPRLESDLVEVMEAVIDGRLGGVEVRWQEGSAVCVVVASGGYPGSYARGKVITGLDAADKVPGVTVFHAGTATRDGEIVTAGGRVLGVTATGGDIRAAIARAYQAAAMISFDGAQYRKDIGRRALERLKRE